MAEPSGPELIRSLVRPVVFVSSTIADLHDARTALYGALLSKGFSPLISELSVDFPVRSNAGNLETIEQAIAGCDFYVLLIDKTRGSLIPNTDQSFTEHEFATALAAGKTIVSLCRSSTWDAWRTWIANSRRDIQFPGIVGDLATVAKIFELIDRASQWGPSADPSRWVSQFNDLLDLVDKVLARLRIERDRTGNLPLSRQNVDAAFAELVGCSVPEDASDSSLHSLRALGFRTIGGLVQFMVRAIPRASPGQAFSSVFDAFVRACERENTVLTRFSAYPPGSPLLPQEAASRLEAIARMIDGTEPTSEEHARRYAHMRDLMSALRRKFGGSTEDNDLIDNEISQISKFLMETVIVDEIQHQQSIDGEARIRFYCTDTTLERAGISTWKAEALYRRLLFSTKTLARKAGISGDIVRMEILSQPELFLSSPRAWTHLRWFCDEHLQAGIKLGLVHFLDLPAEVRLSRDDFFLIPSKVLYCLDREYSIYQIWNGETKEGRNKLDYYAGLFSDLRRHATVLDTPESLTRLEGVIRELAEVKVTRTS